MSNDYVQVIPDSTGKRVDCTLLTIGAVTAERQRIVLGDDTTAAALAAVMGSAPAGTEYALVTRNIPGGTQTVAGTITANLGTAVVTAVISGTPTVTFGSAVIGSGTITANIGNAIPTGSNQIGSISAAITNTPTITFGTTTVAGTVTANLASGLNQIGSVTASISGTPTVTFGTATVTFGTSTVTFGNILGGTITTNLGSAIPTGSNVIGTVTANVIGTITATITSVQIKGSQNTVVNQNAGDNSLITTAQGYTGAGTAIAGFPLVIGVEDSLGRVQYMQGDGTGYAYAQGVGAAGTPSGGVMSIQPVSSITAATIGATGTIATITGNGAGSVGIHVANTWTGTVVFEGEIGTAYGYFPIAAVPYGGGAAVTSTTANGQWQANIAGLARFRVRTSAYSSGTVSLTLNTNPDDALVSLNQALPIGANQIGSVTATLSGTSTIAGTVTATISGTPTVTFGTATVAGTITANLGAGANQVGSVTAIISGTPTVTFGTATVTFGAIAGTVTCNQTDSPNASGGWTPTGTFALTGTVFTIKSGAGNLGAYNIYNPNSSVAYVQFFDATTVTIGTTTPVNSFGIPPNAAEVLDSSKGTNFATAIKVAATTTVTGGTGVTTGVVANFNFK